MRILSTESFSHIVPLTRENYANIHARLNLRLPPRTARLFSRFTLQPSQGGAQWSVPMECENSLRPYTEANAVERAQVGMVLRQALDDVRKAFGPQAATMEKLLDVPHEVCIFFAPQHGAQPVVVLAQWGFRRVRAASGAGLLKLCLDRAEALTDAPVEIYVGYTDGSPAADKDFILHIFGNEIPFRTDSRGIYSPGHIMVGKEFMVSGGGLVSPLFTVEASRARYDVLLSKTTSLTVCVAEAGGSPAEGVGVTADGMEAVTDADGKCLFSPVPYDGERDVRIEVRGAGPVVHRLKEEAGANVVNIMLDAPEPEEPVPPVPEPVTLTLRMLDKKGTPMAGMPVKILCKRGYEDTVTDDAGCVRLNAADLLPGETPRIILRRPEPDTGNKPLNQTRKL